MTFLHFLLAGGGRSVLSSHVPGRLYAIRSQVHDLSGPVMRLVISDQQHDLAFC
jgi:hypothetical protein